MKSVLQLRGENFVNQPLPVDAAEADEQLRDDQHAKVAFTESVMSRMALVAVAVVDDVKPPGRQSRSQFVVNPLRNTHG